MDCYKSKNYLLEEFLMESKKTRYIYTKFLSQRWQYLSVAYLRAFLEDKIARDIPIIPPDSDFATVRLERSDTHRLHDPRRRPLLTSRVSHRDHTMLSGLHRACNFNPTRHDIETPLHLLPRNNKKQTDRGNEARNHSRHPLKRAVTEADFYPSSSLIPSSIAGRDTTLPHYSRYDVRRTIIGHVQCVDSYVERRYFWNLTDSHFLFQFPFGHHWNCCKLLNDNIYSNISFFF